MSNLKLTVTESTEFDGQVFWNLSKESKRDFKKQSAIT